MNSTLHSRSGSSVVIALWPYSFAFSASRSTLWTGSLLPSTQTSISLSSGRCGSFASVTYVTSLLLVRCSAPAFSPVHAIAEFPRRPYGRLLRGELAQVGDHLRSRAALLVAEAALINVKSSTLCPLFTSLIFLIII